MDSLITVHEQKIILVVVFNVEKEQGAKRKRQGVRLLSCKFNEEKRLSSNRSGFTLKLSSMNVLQFCIMVV